MNAAGSQNRPGTRAPFVCSAEDLKTVVPDTAPIPITRLCDRISAPFAGNGRRKLCYRELTDALTRLGILTVIRTEGSGKRTVPTPIGASLGLFTEECGTRATVLYSPAAQRYILDNFDAIMRIIIQAREARCLTRRRAGDKE